MKSNTPIDNQLNQRRFKISLPILGMGEISLYLLAPEFYILLKKSPT
jgi:hypothetical protein